MIKYNTQANDMATMANNWRGPGASNPGRYKAGGGGREGGSLPQGGEATADRVGVSSLSFIYSFSFFSLVVTPLKTLMGFSVHLNVQLKFYNLPYLKSVKLSVQKDLKIDNLTLFGYRLKNELLL